MRTLCAALLLAVAVLHAQPSGFFPIDQIRPGMQGVGKTVFEGDRIDEFQVEILGVLENIGPKQSLILGRLSGGPLEKTGVMAGMSGSPVYLDGKLAGAVAYSFPFSTDAIAGIRPIAEMVNAAVETRQAASAPTPAPAAKSNLSHPLLAKTTLSPPGPEIPTADPQLLPIATPTSFGGFPAGTFTVFGDQLRTLGLRPLQGVAGSLPEQAPGAAGPLQPGAMITVSLISGDLDVSAAGTLTHLDGDRVYAFGHRFLSAGPTELPISRSRVLTLLPNLSNSFKITGSGEMIGMIDNDQSTGVSGRIGALPELLPVEIRVTGSANRDYQLKLVNDPFLTPFLLQLATYAAADADERQVGPATYRVKGSVEFSGGQPELRLDDVYAGSSSVPLLVSLGTAVPLAYVLQSGVEKLRPSRITLALETEPVEKISQLVRAWADKNRAPRGETLELTAVLRDPDGQERLETLQWPIPSGLRPGEAFITFADGQTLNMLEWQSVAAGRSARSGAELIRAVNRLRRSDRLYARVWRQEPTFRLQTERLPAPPASVAGILSAPAATGGSDPEFSSTLAEFELPPTDGLVQGSVTLKVVVTE